MVFQKWAHIHAPLHSQWPVLKSGGADFIVGLLILCSKDVLGLKFFGGVPCK